MVESAAAVILLKPFVWEPAPLWLDARMLTVSAQRVVRVFRARLKFCARISCARSSCLAVRQSRSSTQPTSIFRESGLQNDDAMKAQWPLGIVQRLGESE